MLSSCKFGSVQTGSYPVCLYAPSPELRTRSVQSSGWTKLEQELNHQFSSAGSGSVHQFRTELWQPYSSFDWFQVHDDFGWIMSHGNLRQQLVDGFLFQHVPILTVTLRGVCTLNSQVLCCQP